MPQREILQIIAPAAIGRTHSRAMVSSRSDIAVMLLFGAAVLAFVILRQHLDGAVTAEFSSDAASHYISGVMIHDYLLSGLHSNPVTYLKYFHAHYPLVGIGGWPPFYYFVEAAWMLAFSTSHLSVLLLSASVTASVVMALYYGVASALGRFAGAAVGIAFAISPLVQAYTGELMLDTPVALFCLVSMLTYDRYLTRGRARYSAAFGVLAAIALLIKGNAGCLALMPLFVILIGRRFELLRRPSFWLPVPIVLLLAGPWYALTLARPTAGFRYAVGLHYMHDASLANAGYLLAALGPLALAVALLGIARLCVAGGRAEDSSLAPCAAALAAAVFVFQLAVPVALQDRYMIPALPPLLIVAVNEVYHWSSRIAGLWRRLPFVGSVAGLQLAGLVILLLSLLPLAIARPVYTHDGMAEVARQIWLDRLPDNPSVLVATDDTGEGEAIAALARQDPERPSLFAVRGSRLLGGGGYNNSEYVPRFASPAEVMTAIDRYKIPFVLFRRTNTSRDWTHLQQIDEARCLYPERWRLIYSDDRHSPAIQLFRISGNDREKADTAALLALSGPHALSDASP